MWSLEFTSAWMRLDVTCRLHALAESEPFITPALAMFPYKRPAVACTRCEAEARSNNVQITRSRDGMSPLEPLPALATDMFLKLQVDISERVNLLRSANLAATFSNRARPESWRFASRPSHGTLAFCASDPPTTGTQAEQYDAVFHVAVLSHLRSTIILHPLHSSSSH
jgi:hypothetical protein